MGLNKFTGSTVMDGTEKPLYKIVGTTMKHFMAYIYLKSLQAGESIRLRVYNKVDDVSHWKLDGDVTDSVGGNNGTVTNISSLVSQWKFDGNVNDSVGSNNGTITYHTNLKGLYKFENNVNDSTTGANNGTVTGTSTFVTGQEGQAFSFDGSSYITTVNTNYSFAANQAFSLSFWFKTTSSAETALLVKETGLGTAAGYGVYKFTDNKVYFFISDGTNQNNVGSTITLNDGLWHYITCTFDGSANRSGMKLYVDGVLNNTGSAQAIGTITNASNLIIGADVAANFKFTGTMDEARIYNIAVTQAQVSALYMNGKFGQSHTFDGGELIATANSPFNFDKTNTFSISLWFMTSVSGSDQVLISKDQTNATGTAGYTIFQFSGDNKIYFSLDDGSALYQVATTTTYNDGNWHNLVCTFDGSSNRSGMKIYIDGVLNNTGSALAISSNITNSQNLTIGSYGTAGSQFTGQLDEVRVYNSTLTASQVLGLYNYTGSNYVTPLPVGNALSLDGSSYVTVNNQAPYNFERTNAFSVSGWFKTTASTSTQGIICKNNGVNTTGWDLYLTTGGNIKFRLINTLNTNEIHVTTVNGYADGVWHNVVITYSGNSLASGVNIYVDGSSVSFTTNTNNLSATIQNSNKIFIGTISNTFNFSGLIDEVQIFNYVVSSAEINAINAGRFANTHPIGLWHFDGDLYDYSGQGSTGTPTGTMTYVTGALSGSYNVPNTHFNFDGSEYISVGNPTNLQFEKTNPMSFAFWFRDSTTGGTSTIISKVATQTSAGYRVTINGSNLLLLSLTNVNSTNQVNVSTASSVRDGLWHFGVLTYSGSGTASGVTIYIDGSAVSMTTIADTLTGSIQTSANVIIGATADGNNNHCAELDDLRVYNRALSSAEVSDLYTYPDSAMKSLVYDKTYTGVVSDTKYIVPLQGNQMMVTAQQLNGTNRLITWEREEVS